MIDLAPMKDVRHCYTDDIQVGYYTTCSVTPTCGLATNKDIIGSLDDARVFSFPIGSRQAYCGLAAAMWNTICPTTCRLDRL